MLRTFAIVIAGAGIFASLPLTNARACWEWWRLAEHMPSYRLAALAPSARSTAQSHVRAPVQTALCPGR
jgi:hypothetical protein